MRLQPSCASLEATHRLRFDQQKFYIADGVASKAPPHRLGTFARTLGSASGGASHYAAGAVPPLHQGSSEAR